MRRALIVGVDTYPDGVDDLDGCVADARAIERLLARNHDGTPNFDCMMLTTAASASHYLPTRSNMKAHLRRLFEPDCDVALFYFAGHGSVIDEGACLHTTDAATADDAVSMRDVMTLATKSTVREVFIILDCCHSGAMGDIPEISEHTLTRHGLTILTATTPLQEAAEVAGRGVFSQLLCAGLEGGAADVAGRITSASLYSFVNYALGSWQQRPLFKANVSRLTTLRLSRPLAPIETLRHLPQLFPDKDAHFDLDPSYEPEAEPKHPEHERMFKELQILNRVNIVAPIGEEHMYHAAIHSKSCELTEIGKYYWLLANNGRL